MLAVLAGRPVAWPPPTGSRMDISAGPGPSRLSWQPLLPSDFTLTSSLQSARRCVQRLLSQLREEGGAAGEGSPAPPAWVSRNPAVQASKKDRVESGKLGSSPPASPKPP